MTPQPAQYIDSPKASTVEGVPIPLVTRRQVPSEIPISGTFGPSSAIDRLRPVVSGADFTAIVVGNGVSDASFIPIPSRHPRLTNRQIAEAVTPKDLADKHAVWQRFLAYRGSAARRKPNLTHEAIGEFINRLPNSIAFDLNTEGLLEKVATHRVFPIRGSIWRNVCERGHVRTDTHCGPYDPEDAERHYVPACPTCGRAERPDVLLRGELPDQERFKSLLEFGKGTLASADVVVLIGITMEDFRRPLFDALRPQIKRSSDGGFVGEQFLIEVTSETRQFMGSLLVGNLDYIATKLLAPCSLNRP